MESDGMQDRPFRINPTDQLFLHQPNKHTDDQYKTRKKKLWLFYF
jgi:hypothetical protein